MLLAVACSVPLPHKLFPNPNYRLHSLSNP
jgi:hypothetical protein